MGSAIGKLIGGAALLALCAGLLAAATLAWHSGTIYNAGNKVKAESLTMEAYAYDGGPDGVDLTTQMSLNESHAPLISSTAWEAGETRVKYLEIRNRGTEAAKIRLNFTVSDASAIDAFWYTFEELDASWSPRSGQTTVRPMDTLESLGEIYAFTVRPQDVLRLRLEYGVRESVEPTQEALPFVADVSVSAVRDTGSHKVVKVYDVVDFADTDDSPVYRLMQDITGDVSLTHLASIDLNGHTLKGNVVFGEKEPILSAGTITVGSDGGVIEGNVTIHAPNAEIRQYGNVHQFQINGSASQTLYFYGQAKTLLFRQGTLVMEKGSSADTVTLQRSAGKPVSIVNDGIIRELNVPQVKDADPPVVTGNAVQSLREGSEADLSGAVLWDGEQLKEPNQSGGVYRVGSAAELAWIAAKIDDRSLGKISVLLTADIDLNNREWTPIGSYIPFSGTFDGGGHTISRLQIFEGAQNSGLFGQVRGAVIQNLQVQDAYLKNVGSNSGVLVGRAFGCTLQNCRVSEALIAADESAAAIGGLIGSAEDGILGLSRCTVSDTRISGYFSLGGLLGNCVVPEMTAAVVSSCRAEGVTVAAAPYDGNVKAWKGKHVQTHGFIGSVRADASSASFTVTGCSMEDCSTNADADAMIGGPAINAWMGRGTGDIRIR